MIREIMVMPPSDNSNTPTEQVTLQLLKYRQILKSYIFTIVRDHHMAEDVLQETALALVRQADRWGEIYSFWSLSREIARRQSLKALERKGRQGAVLSKEALEIIV